MDFVSILFICAKRTGNFELQMSSLEHMLQHLIAGSHGKYTAAILHVLPWKTNMKKVVSP